jgi:UDP-N-acetylglucosamine 2-epimerase (non-hydrolysing)
VGYYHRCPVAHVEAGLRTYEREPFPEEKNRQLIGRLANWHFAPTEQARLNLLGEGIAERCIYEVGNTVIDAALWTRDHIAEPSFELAEYLPRSLQRFLAAHDGAPLVLVTAHRRENWGEPIRDIATAVALMLEENPGTVAVWPVHPNPGVRADVGDGLADVTAALRNRILLTEPLGYPAMIHLLTRARFTLTDSGGIQEEASALGVPVLIARDSTERQELVDDGGAALVGTEIGVMVAAASSLLENAEAHAAMCIAHSPFGDGRSAERIARILSEKP